jgi:hypothetical protein
MTLIDLLFSVARNITDGDINELNKLQERAKNETATYHTEQTGYKGLYAKLNNNWMIQLGFVFAAPFLTAYLIKYKNSMLNENLRDSNYTGEDFDDDDWDDDEEENEYRRLKEKFG